MGLSSGGWETRVTLGMTARGAATPEFEEVLIPIEGGHRGYARYWPAAGAPRGGVLFFHGIQSHAGWYEASARLLREAGMAVLQPDRRGSGRNERDRGHADSAEQLIGDGRLAAQWLQRRSGLDRLVLLGVSWGGKLAAALHVREPGLAVGLALIAPGLFPIIDVSPAEKFRIGLAMVSAPLRSFDIPLNDATLFTADPDRQCFIEEDFLTLRQATAGFYLASRRMDRICARLRESPPVPLFLALAGQEGIIHNGRTRAFIEGLSWPGTAIHEYPTARHSIEFEACRESFFSDLITWFDTTLSAENTP